MTRARSWTMVGALLALLAVGAVGGTAAGTRAKPKTVRISVKANGSEVPASQSEYPAISANGRFIAFESTGRLLRKDKDGEHDIYLYDRRAKRNRLVSITSDGKAGQDLEGESADISPNGRWICFVSESAFVNGDTNAIGDVYRHDRRTGKTIRVSVMGDGSQLTGINDESYICGVADNGLVAWESGGAFVNDDTNGDPDIFVRNTAAKTTRRASLDYQDNQLAGGGEAGKATKVAISGNGKFVVFSSSDVATADPDSAFGLGTDSDVFVRNISNGTTTRASLRSNGEEPVADGENANSRVPSISADGRYVAFISDAPFGAADGNLAFDIYVKDRQRGRVLAGSVKSNEDFIAAPGNNWFEISPDGRYVAWDAFGNYGGVADPGNFRDVYRRDLDRGRTKLISLKTNGEHAGFDSQLPDVPNDGRFIPFQSMEQVTPKPDDGSDWDVFLRGPVR